MNAIKRWILRKELTDMADQAIEKSKLSPKVKAYLIGLANAAISGLAASLGSVAAGVTFKQGAIIVASAMVMSMVKWMAQHPIDAGS